MSIVKDEQLRRVTDSGIVAIIRAPDGRLLADVADVLYAAGIRVMEITFTVPKAHKVLEVVADRLGDKILLGAGTVLDPETAQTAIAAGAEFIVSPSTNLDVIAYCRRHSKVSMPGAFTPTEIVNAWQAGADFVKVFPCDFVGPNYLKVLRGPLPQVKMIPTGGVSVDTAADFLRAGAAALGAGSALVEAKALAAGDLGRIEQVAREFVRIVGETRAAMAK